MKIFFILIGSNSGIFMATQVNPQTVQVPNYSGVNIQIINPAVNVPGNPCATPPMVTYNPQSYPQEYYTNTYGNPPATANATATVSQNGEQVAKSEDNKDVKKDVKKEKRQIVKLTDDYIKTLENYLNSQNADIRKMGAKEVLARLQEDDSRKNDVALNALVNKMLQDPSAPIKFIAMAALESGAATGDSTTVQILQQLQNSKTGYGQDSAKASNILLKMAGDKVEKEFEVKEKPKKTEKTETKKESVE